MAVHSRAANSLGLMPWDAARLSPRELEDLGRAARREKNRDGRLATWLVGWLPWAIAMGIRVGLGDDKLHGVSFEEMLESLPDYERDEAEDQ